MASNPGFGVPVKTRLNVSGPQNLPQALYGDIVYRLVLSGNVALTTEKGDPAERQSIDYMTDLWDRDFDSTNWSFQSPKIDDYEEQEDIS